MKARGDPDGTSDVGGRRDGHDKAAGDLHPQLSRRKQGQHVRSEQQFPYGQNRAAFDPDGRGVVAAAEHLFPELPQGRLDGGKNPGLAPEEFDGRALGGEGVVGAHGDLRVILEHRLQGQVLR